MTPPQQTWPSPEFLEDLVYAARANALDEIQAYVQDSEDTTWTREQRVDFLSSALDEGRNTALHVAAANGHLDMVQYLLSLRAPPQFLSNASGNTAIHWAAQHGHLDILKALRPWLSAETVLLKNLRGEDAIGLAEARGTEQALECAGWLMALTPEQELEKEKKMGEVGQEEEEGSEESGDQEPEQPPQEGLERLDLNKETSS